MPTSPSTWSATTLWPTSPVNIDRLDMAFLRRSLGKHSTGLSLLPHPVQLEDAGLIREEHLQRMIGLLAGRAIRT